MKIRFFTHWIGMSEEQRKAAIPDERIYQSVVQEIEKIGSYKDKKELENDNEDFLNSHANQLEYVLEYIKLRMSLFEEKDGSKFEKIAITALGNDENKNSKLEVAINIHRRLLNCGSEGKEFKTAAKN